MAPGCPARAEPLEVQATSYLALSASIVSLSITLCSTPPPPFALQMGIKNTTRARRRAARVEKQI